MILLSAIWGNNNRQLYSNQEEGYEQKLSWPAPSSQPPTPTTVSNKFLLFNPPSLWQFCYSNLRKLIHIFKNKRKIKFIYHQLILKNRIWAVHLLYYSLLLAALGLACGVQACSSCLEQGAPLQLWRGLFTAVASLAVAHGLQRAGTEAVAHRLSFPEARGVFSDQGSNPCCLPCRWILNHWTPGKPCN